MTDTQDGSKPDAGIHGAHGTSDSKSNATRNVAPSRVFAIAGFVIPRNIVFNVHYSEIMKPVKPQ
jgi:hypothetical protein